jgi:hypothetical protein
LEMLIFSKASGCPVGAGEVVEEVG